MKFLAEYAGSLVFLLGGYAYMCNISLKKTLISSLNYVELVIAWGLAVGLGLATAVTMGGPAFLNPGAVLGNMIWNNLSLMDAALYLLMEFLAAGTAIFICMIFFWDSFRASEGTNRGIFSAYPVEKNIPLNFVQEILATFLFLFLVLLCITYSGGNALIIGAVGFAAVALLSLSLNSTGSSWMFAILPIPGKKGETPDWGYQLIVNLAGSSIGGILAVIAVACIQKSL